MLFHKENIKYACISSENLQVIQFSPLKLRESDIIDTDTRQNMYIPTKIDSLVCPFGRVVMIAVRSHLEGSVGAEAAPRMPYEKHCRQWCLTPPPGRKQKKKFYSIATLS